MNNIKLFIHGVPIGHEMYGCDTDDERDYLKQFYDMKFEPSSALVTDIIGGISYYTYVRKNNFSNAEGRPNSYFGLTISFGKNTCNKVYQLYRILDSIYKQVIVGSIVKEKNSATTYIVKGFEGVTITSHDILVVLKSILQKNIEQYIGDDFSAIDKTITTKGIRTFNLEEVDSPAFDEVVHAKQVFVSPEFLSNVKAVANLNNLEAEKNRLEQENGTLKSNNQRLETEVSNLTKELKDIEGNTQKKYKTDIDKLKKSVDNLTKENNDLTELIDQAKQNIDLIDKPSKELMRLLASRFRQDDKSQVRHSNQENYRERDKNKFLTWIPVCNCVLLLGIIGLFISLLFHSPHSTIESPVNNQDSIMRYDSVTNNGGDRQTVTVTTADVKTPETEEQKQQYDAFKVCAIDVKGYNDGLEKNQSYSLSVVKRSDRKLANVPNGDWNSTEGVTIHNGTLYVNSDAQSGQNVQVFYVINNQKVITRTIKIK